MDLVWERVRLIPGVEARHSYRYTGLLSLGWILTLLTASLSSPLTCTEESQVIAIPDLMMGLSGSLEVICKD